MFISNPMKPYHYIPLLLIILLQSGGISLYYKIQQSLAHNQAHHKLHKKNTRFHKLTLTLSEYHHSKVEHDEIRLNGKMYDVKSAKIVGNTVELQVIHDTEEETMFKEIRKFFDRTNQPNSQFNHHLQLLLTLSYLPPSYPIWVLTSSFSKSVFNTPAPTILSGYISLATPPPERG